MSAKNEWEYYRLRQELSALKAKQRARNARIKAAGYLPTVDMTEGYKIVAKYAPLPSTTQFKNLSDAEQQDAIRSIQGQIETKKYNLDRPTSTLSGIKEAHVRMLQRGPIIDHDYDALNARNLDKSAHQIFKENFNRARALNQSGYDKFLRAQRLFASIDTDPKFKRWDPDKRERFKQYLRSLLDPTKDDYNPDFVEEPDPDKVKKHIKSHIKTFRSLEKSMNPKKVRL